MGRDVVGVAAPEIPAGDRRSGDLVGDVHDGVQAMADYVLGED